MSFLDRSRTIAGPGFSRWMVPPAALVHSLVHRSGLRLQRLQPADDQADRHHAVGPGRLEADRARLDLLDRDLRPRHLGGACSVAGSRKADRAGPCSRPACAGRSASSFPPSASTSTISGSSISATAFFGGIGLGLGYISPVSTLIKWFPDRPGMATGMAIMGFGGGAFIASPLSVWLMQKFSTPTHVGVAEAFIGLGVIYFIFMWVGAAIVRIPAPGLEAGRLHAAGSGEEAGHQERRLRLRRAEDAAVLADLVGALPQRHRRHRRARPGLGDEPGDVPRPHHAGGGGGLRRAAEPVQHGRPLLLGFDVGLHRPQEHLLRLLRARNGALRAGAVDRLDRQHRRCSCCASW